MKNHAKLLKKYSDPFSDKAKELSLKFDSATIDKDTEKLNRLFDEAESILKQENNASKAMIYYSLGTSYDDLARLTGIQTEVAFQKGEKHSHECGSARTREEVKKRPQMM